MFILINVVIVALTLVNLALNCMFIYSSVPPLHIEAIGYSVKLQAHSNLKVLVVLSVKDDHS